MTTKLTLEIEDRKIVIEIDADGLTADDFISELVKPIMLAATYHPNSVYRATGADIE